MVRQAIAGTFGAVTVKPTIVYFTACVVSATGQFEPEPHGKRAAVILEHIVAIVVDQPEVGGIACSLIVTTTGRRYVVGSVEDIVRDLERAVDSR